jgi:hypothetical protein
MAKWKELSPSPEAIVRAALERAAEGCKYLDAETPYWPGQFQNFIRSLATDPAEVAAILKAAGEDRG